MTVPPRPALALQAEKALPHPVHPHLVAYCPTMDLVAVVTQLEQVDVYRLNGRRAFGLKRRSAESTVDAMCWKFNGHLLAVAWDDGAVDIVSAETGKVIRHGVQESLGARPAHAARVGRLGWGVHVIDVPPVKRRTSGATKARGADRAITGAWDVERDAVSLDDFLDRQPDRHRLEVCPDLPDQLALTDVESLLPKLPALPLPPATGPMRTARDSGPEIFTSQASVDAMLHAHHLKDPNAVDVLLRCDEGGVVSPLIYDSLEIGRLGMPDAWGMSGARPVVHASHPFSCSHDLVMHLPKTADRPPRLALCPLTLRFIPSAGRYLHLIASKTAQLQRLLRYVHQTLKCIGDYWRHAQDLPSKWMANANEALAARAEGDIVQGLYHLAATGHCSATLKEWLVEDVGENNHKRWDHASGQGYAKIVELAHENLLPALDRCSLVVCTLRGLARYHESSRILDVPVRDFTDVLDVVRCLRLIGHQILSDAAEDRRQFAVFSTWLRLEMDNQRAEAATATEEGAVESGLGAAYADLLAYIRGAMTRSRLKPYLELHAPEAGATTAEETAPAYEDVRRDIEHHRQGRPYDETRLHANTVSLALQRLARDLFRRITAWQVTSSSMNCGLVLEDEGCSSIDVRMLCEGPADSKDMNTYVATVPTAAKQKLRLHRIVHLEIFDDVSSAVCDYEVITIQFGHGSIQDAKFADDTSLMVLFTSGDTSFLLSLPFSSVASEHAGWALPASRDSPTTRGRFDKVRLPSGTAERSRRIWDLREAAQLRRYAQHVFPKDERFVPVKLEVNGRKDRRVVLVLGEDLRHYRVFDLDFADDGSASEESDTAMTD